MEDRCNDCGDTDCPNYGCDAAPADFGRTSCWIPKVRGKALGPVVVDEILKMGAPPPPPHALWERWMSEWYRHAASAVNLMNKSQRAAKACMAVSAGAMSPEEGRKARQDAADAWRECAKLWR